MTTLERFFPYPAETAAYLSNVSDRFGYFYLANPKAASTTVLKTLQRAEVDGDPARLPAYVNDRPKSPLLTVSNSVFSPEQILGEKRYFLFTYVRNPFTRVLSAYLDKVVQVPSERARLLPGLGLDPGNPVTFLDFLQALHDQRDAWRDIHWSTQSRLVQSNTVAYDFIGRFESFAVTFPLLLDRLGVDRRWFEPDEPPAHATGAGTRLAEFLGKKERELVLTIYDADFANFGYGRDPAMATA